MTPTVTMKRLAGTSPRLKARIAGVLYFFQPADGSIPRGLRSRKVSVAAASSRSRLSVLTARYTGCVPVCTVALPFAATAR